MTAMTPVKHDDPRWIAWQAWLASEEGKNAMRWAMTAPQYVEGSMWSAFIAGFAAK